MPKFQQHALSYLDFLEVTLNQFEVIPVLQKYCSFLHEPVLKQFESVNAQVNCLQMV